MRHGLGRERIMMKLCSMVAKVLFDGIIDGLGVDDHKFLPLHLYNRDSTESNMSF